VLAAHSVILYFQLYLVIFEFLNFKQERDVRAVGGIYLVGLLFIDTIRHIYYGYQIIKWYDIMISILPMIVILRSLKTWRLWWLVVISYVFISFTSTVISYFFFAIFQMNPEYLLSNSLYSVIGGSLGLSMLLLFNCMIKKAKIKLDIQRLTKGEIVFIVMFLMLFGHFIFNILPVESNNIINDLIFRFLTFFGGVIGIYAIFYLIAKNTRLKDVEKKDQMQQEINKQQKLLFAKIEEQNLEVRRFKHDIDFELTKLNDHAENGDLKEILLHIAEMREDFSTRSQVEWVETGINELNANLLALRIMPEYKEVKLKWSGGIPNKIKMSSRDKSLLFSNIFKNAFEAASKCDGEKWVCVNVVAQENRLKIEIKNNFTGEINQLPNGSFMTSKKDKLNHGFGTITIMKIVKKYNGNISFEYKDNVFKVKIGFTQNIYNF